MKKSQIILLIILVIETFLIIGEINNKVSYTKDIIPEQNQIIGELNKNNNRERKQKIYSPYNNLKSIKIIVGTYQRENIDNVKFELYEENGNKLREKIINTKELLDNKPYEIRFGTLKNSKGKNYYFKLVSSNEEKMHTITVYSDKNGEILYSLGYKKFKSNLLLCIFCSAIIFINIFVYFLLKNEKIQKKEHKFLCIILSYGVLWMFVFPPLQVPDENVHFLRAYSIAKGQFIPKKVGSGNFAELPVSLEEFEKDSDLQEVASHSENKVNFLDLKKIYKIKINKEKTKSFELGGAAVINPISYIPQSIGIKVGESLNIPLYLLYYLGRIFNFFSWILLVYSAIKISPPKLKNMFFIFSLLPVSLQQAISYSTDALINGFSFLFIAVVFKLYLDDKEKINIKYLILLFLGVFFPTSIKVVYFLFVIFILLLFKKFDKKRNCLITFFVIFFLTLAFNIFWSKLSPENPSGDISLQLDYLKHNPIKYLKTLYITSKISTQFYIESYIGILGWLDTRIPYLLMYSYIILVIVNIYSDNILSKNDLKAKFMIFIYLILSYIGILTALYIVWSEVGQEYVMGVQGRYFVPVVPLLYILLSKRRIFVKKQILDSNTEIFMNFGLSMMILVFLSRYYI